MLLLFWKIELLMCKALAFKNESKDEISNESKMKNEASL